MITNPPKRLTGLITKKTAYEERNLENRIPDSTIYLDRHRRIFGRDELHVVEHYKHEQEVPVSKAYRHFFFQLSFFNHNSLPSFNYSLYFSTSKIKIYPKRILQNDTLKG